MAEPFDLLKYHGTNSEVLLGQEITKLRMNAHKLLVVLYVDIYLRRLFVHAPFSFLGPHNTLQFVFITYSTILLYSRNWHDAR